MDKAPEEEAPAEQEPETNGSSAPKIRSGRVGRTAGVGGLVVGQGARWAGTRIANLARGEERSREKTDERVGQIATQLAKQLGQMKGAAMKIGQALSTVELPGLSEEGQEEFREAMAELRDNAPTFDYADIEKVVREDYDGPISDRFASFDEDAFAAASIGQVHRANTLEGREVAVKVQYPGVAEAVEVDLRNLHLILRLVKRMAPGLDAKAVGSEIRERITEELDYELEAQRHREIARAYRGHPFAVVPAVDTSLSTRRVLVTELLDGLRFDQVCELPEPERDRFGEAVFRFFLGTRYRLGIVLGDPHPGNYLGLAGGRVGFLDFGLLRKVPAEHLELETGVAAAIADERADDVHNLLATLGYLPDPDAFDPDDLLDQVRTGAEWLFEPGFRRLDPAYARDLLERVGSPRSPHYEAMKNQTVPPASVLMRRQEALILVVLSRLEAGADWAAVGREYTHGEPTATEMGEADWAFWEGKPHQIPAG
ncbi:MAG: ABC1 kinase family protein [Solirubrobacterales bacterium]